MKKICNFFYLFIIILLETICLSLANVENTDAIVLQSTNSNHKDFKRSSNEPSYGIKSQQQQVTDHPSHDSVVERFHTSANTIIRTHDSRSLGAKYLNETELSSNEECLIWCWETNQCNLAVFEEKTRGSCYLFDCGSSDDFRCKFTQHKFYSSSVLTVNRHQFDLKQWENQAHEQELVKLRSKSPDLEQISSSTSRPQFVQHLSAPSTSPTTTLTNLAPPKTSHCQRYQYECKNDSECIAIYNVCDGIPQCSDGSDEDEDLQCHKSNNKQKTPEPFSINNNITPQQKSNLGNNRLNVDSRVSTEKNKPQTVPKQLPKYNYPKLPDSGITNDNTKTTEDQSAYRKPHGSLNEFGNNYNLQFRNGWNPYYPTNDIINGGDNNRASDYLIEQEYANYNRDPTGQYWSPLNRQQPVDISDQLLRQGQLNFPALRTGQNTPDDPPTWQQLSYPNFYDRKSTFRVLDDNNNVNEVKNSKPISQDALNMKINTKIQANKQQQQSQLNANSATLQDLKIKQSLDNQKYEQQLKFQSQGKAHPSMIKSNKMMMSSSSNTANVVAISYMPDSNESSGRETNSAVIALTLGLGITALLVVLVGCRMKSIKRRFAKRGRSLAHDADFLVNGMYL